MQDVEFAPLRIERFRAVLDGAEADAFERAVHDAATCFEGRTLWCINSTATGGGVAEMLASLMGYLVGAGIDARWSVIRGTADFFALTKRLHNRLHGADGDGGPLGARERGIYEDSLCPSVEALSGRVRPGDVVIVHDPQPAGLLPALQGLGATVVWRCHIGVDESNDLVAEAVDFLLPYVRQADLGIFSRPAYVWPGRDRVATVPPSIDAFSPKNQELDRATVRTILGAAGVMPRKGSAPARFERPDGSPRTVSSRARTVEETPLPDDVRLVLQVSRWDRLKDPVGVLHGFARHVPRRMRAHLVLAGPLVSGVTDDPEGAQVLQEVEAAWRALDPEARRRIHLVCVPVEDDQENKAIVNALQRRADVVVQKSLAEGFGLTVAEAMWKHRPVVASGVGGIRDQIVDRESGWLIDDPRDLEAFGRAVTELLRHETLAADMGRAAHDRVRERFLATRHILQYLRLLGAPGQNPAEVASGGSLS